MALAKRQPGGKVKMTPWRQDPIILRRIEYVADQHAAGRSLADIALELGITPQTVASDWNHAIELYSSQATDSVREHVANIRSLKRRITSDLEHLPQDRQVVGRATLVSELRKLEELEARLDGTEYRAKAAAEADAPDRSVTFSLTIASPEVHVNAIEAPGRPALPEPKLVGSDDIEDVEPDA